MHEAVKKGKALAEEAEKTIKFFNEALIPHFKAEEDVLFPVMVKHLKKEDTMINDLLGEHRILEKMITVLDGDPARLEAFAKALENHIRVEERLAFERYQEVVPEEERKRTGAALKEFLKR